MKNPRSEPTSRREEILLAARRLFVEHGIPGTSMRVLAREIGVTEGALYRHFPSKDDIVAEVFAGEAGQFHDHLHASLEKSRTGARTGKSDWSRDLEVLVRAFVDYGRREPESFRVIMVLHQSPGVKRRPIARMPRHLFEAVLEEAPRSGRRGTENTAVVVMIAGLLSRLIQAEHEGQLGLGRDAVCELAVRAVRGMVEAALELDGS